jgi:hypothetical protein
MFEPTQKESRLVEAGMEVEVDFYPNRNRNRDRNRPLTVGFNFGENRNH